MSNAFMFSVIVPVYNAEKTLISCVNSILGQSFKDFEVLLIDDGSTDDSSLICDDFCSNDIRVKVLHKDNGGVSSARNAGLMMAEGKWIVFVDADDMLDKEWLTVYANNVDNLGCDVLFVQRAKMIQGNLIQEVLHATYTGFIEKDRFFTGGKYGYLWNKCFSRKVITSENIRFDETMSCFEDEIFILEYSQKVQSFYVSDSTPMYNYFLPDFKKKYDRDSTFIKQYYRYCRTKSLSQQASTILVDWLIMTMLKECARDSSKVKNYALATRKSVNKDIKYALGLKKLLLRSASIIDFDSWWIFLVWLYSRLYKFGLLK